MVEHDIINWSEVLISAAITLSFGLGIALFFRSVIVEDINKIYRINRSDMIDAMLKDVYRVQEIMGNVFEILEKIPDFNPKLEGTLSIPKNELRLLDYHLLLIKPLYEGFLKFDQWRLFLTMDEILSLANYVAMSHGFVDGLVKYQWYSRTHLTAREGHALQIIKAFPKCISAEFKEAWN